MRIATQRIVCVLSFVVACQASGGAWAEEAATAAPTGENVATASELSPAELRRAVRTALRDQATATDEELPATVTRLMQLRDHATRHAGLSEANREQLLRKLRNRLVRVSKKVGKDLRTRQRRVARAEQAAERRNPEEVAAIAEDKAILAGWQEFLGQFGENDAGQTTGLDNGQVLVKLIESTIVPEQWETNGGTSRIVYFSPLQALVVSAP